MKKSNKLLLLVLSVLSPLWVGLLVLKIANPPSDSVMGLVVVLGVILGSPVILSLGLLTSFLARKNINVNLFFILGFAVPATIISLYEVVVMIG